MTFWRRRYGPYPWMKISESIYRLVSGFAERTDRILEIGCSTGHISFRLAKEGRDVTMIDIRLEPVEEARSIFATNGVKANILHGDIFSHEATYDLAWSSGLIQCFDEEGQRRLVSHGLHVAKQLLLVAPDTIGADKELGRDGEMPVGVAGALEYSVENVPSMIYDLAAEVLCGRIPGKKVNTPFDWLWFHARAK